MRTAIEVAKDGTRTVFHRTPAGAWTHPEGVRGRYRGESGMVTLRCPCPVGAAQGLKNTHA